MQPLSMNAAQGYQYQGTAPNMQPQEYPAYANCFDRLTTNGIIADDLVGYVTGAPSPYLQNYVAQRGWSPSMPGQIMPDALPTAPQPSPMAVNVPQQTQTAYNAQPYSNIPRASELNPSTLEKKDKYSTYKKIAAGVLITGLAALGITKGVKLFRSGGAGFKTAMTNAWNSVKASGSNAWSKVKTFASNAGTKVVNGCKTAFQAVKNFCINLWNKVFHRTPTP